ncbi:hypothetical protein [Streptomyces hiroshimensis]|uniref:Uncharacterized protein n=1 Tax=Streptomyces hiroshimensis TaxID=66424 RepID=A0ABQ2YFD2_9ACTN|nr:hypothetical protein [Streptomyces hiroshimensis]GGX82470.1 hypothetical protein GCM10010324_30100 [Streptomyces hiroshimensis]
MTPTPPPRHPKRHPTTTEPDSADTTAPPASECGQGKAARQGVLSALPADQHPSTPPRGDGRVPVAWLHIRALQGAVPSAKSTCVCGRDHQVVGHGKVLALIEEHTAHRGSCPLRHGGRRKAG